MVKRDTQRGKVYAAGWELPGSTADEFGSLAAAQAYVTQVIESRWFRQRWRTGPIRVASGRGASGVSYGGLITLGVNARNKWTILHELTHEITMHSDFPGHAIHGPEFAASYLLLVQHEMGEECAKLLRAAFVKHGVKHRAAVQRTPRYEVRTQAEETAKRKVRDERPLRREEKDQAAELIRRGVKSGLFGAPGTKPRAHALATARLIEAKVKP